MKGLEVKIKRYIKEYKIEIFTGTVLILLIVVFFFSFDDASMQAQENGRIDNSRNVIVSQDTLMDNAKKVGNIDDINGDFNL